MNIKLLEEARGESHIANENFYWMGLKNDIEKMQMLIDSVGGNGGFYRKSSNKKVKYYIWPQFSQTRLIIDQGTDKRGNVFKYAREHMSQNIFENKIDKIKKDVRDIFYKVYKSKLNNKIGKKISDSFPFLVNHMPQNIKEYSCNSNPELIKFLTNVHPNLDIKRQIIIENGKYFDCLEKSEKKYLCFIEAAIFSKKNKRLQFIKKLKNIQIDVLDYSLMQDPKIFKLIWQQYKKRCQRFDTDPFIIATHKKRLLDLATSKNVLPSLSI
tara:strand:+ start:247 stop:1053 length:807 start_codon:yes stop_codon:yes gene_type:complete